MTVQISAGPVAIGAGDFTHSHKGVTWGLKVRSIQAEDGAPSLDVVIAEQVSGAWVFRQLAVSDALGALDSMGVSSFLSARLIPAINAWLRSRFGTTAPVPTPTPNMPANVAALDAAVAGLKVSIGADGVPVVSV